MPAATAGASGPSAGPVVVTDGQGRTVSLATPARRVVALAPHATELVFAAGGGPQLVGAVRYSDWPAAARLVPQVGDAWHLNAETLVGLRPDLVVAWLPGPVQPLQTALDAASVRVFYTAPTRLADIADDVERLGTLLGTTRQASAKATSLRVRLRGLEQTYADRTPVRVFIHAGSAPLYTLSDNHIVGDALRVCGGVNVFGRAGPAAPQVEMEALIAANPQVILTTDEQGGRDPVGFWRSTAPHLPAVRLARVIAVPADALYRPGPRLFDATAQLCEALEAIRMSRR
ncbi:cobalamin-binding protein [Achromobacter sp. GG226]|nr:cobalamin-binding protein [Verticiella sp. GG226]